MELEFALQRLLMPSILSLIGCYLISTTDQGEDWFDDEPVRGVWFQTIFGAVFCGIGMIAADFWHRGIITTPIEWSQWKARYQWEWMVWVIPGCMLAMALVRSLVAVPIHYVAMAGTLTASMALGVLYLCLNEGDVWQDQADKLLPSLALGSVAVMWNVWAMNSIAKSGGARWVPLVMVAQLGCVAALSLQAYGSLGEWVLTGVGVAIGASVIALIRGSSAKLYYGWHLSTVIIPLGILAVACLVVSRFFESAAVPAWLIAGVGFLPTVVGVIDIFVGRLFNAWLRAALAAVVCCGVLGAIIYFAAPALSTL